MNDPTPLEPEASVPVQDVPTARPIQAELPPITPPPLRCELLLFDLEPRSAWADAGWLALALLAAELVIGVVVHVVATTVYGLPSDGIEAAEPPIRRTLLFFGLGLRALAWIVVALRLNSRRCFNNAHVGLRRDGRLADLGIGLLTVTAVYGVLLATSMWIRLAWPELFKEFEKNAHELSSAVPKLVPLQFGIVSLAVGIYEEIVFRGYLMPRIRRATGSWTFAVLLSSLIFTSLHAFEQNYAAMVLIGFLSLAFSIVTIVRRSILPAIVAHALFDFSQFYGMYITMGDSWK